MADLLKRSLASSEDEKAEPPTPRTEKNRARRSLPRAMTMLFGTEKISIYWRKVPPLFMKMSYSTYRPRTHQSQLTH